MATYRDPSASVDDRVADLLSRMTPEEKAAQLNQAHTESKEVGRVRELVTQGKVGSRILCGSNQAGNDAQKPVDLLELNAVQKIAVEQSRLGIPLINGRDVIHGFRTIFPISLAQAATFDPAGIEAAAAVAAAEARAAGVHWTFAPMVDVCREPRWGRIMESPGEDPYVAARVAEACVRGFQGRDGDLNRDDRLLACAKHFAGYGAPEGGRDYETCEISRTTLRNHHLPAFRAAVRAGVGTLMSGFHDLDGESVSGSGFLLGQILRREWGFRGFVVSDWASALDLVHHRVAEDARDAARLAFSTGVDMDMASGIFLAHVPSLVQENRIPRERLDAAVASILTAKFRLGLFERPYTDPAAAAKVTLTAANRSLARSLARKSIILLRNQGELLPLSTTANIALVGPLVHDRRTLMGNWMIDGEPGDTASIAEAMVACAPKATIAVSSDPQEAAGLARRADVVVLCVGESWARSGENNSVTSLELPHGQEALIRELASFGKPVVLVVLSGRPLVLTQIAPFCHAVVWAWHGGTEAAPALAEILFGAESPSGRLPVTLPRATGQIPIYYNRKSTGKDWPAAGQYQDCAREPFAVFGSGLSYTAFAYDRIQVQQERIAADGTIWVHARVRNTGKRAADAVAQCYVQDCVAGITRPMRELKGFRRIPLDAGEEAEVSFELSAEELGWFTSDGRLLVEPGRFKVWIGDDSRADLEAGFEVR